MKSTIIDKKILLLEFPGGDNGEDNREACMSMVRIDAFWECPDERIRGKRFDWDTLIEALSDENGNMDIYETDGVKQNFFQYMDGFNVSKTNATRFIQKFSISGFTSREKKFIPLIMSLPYNGYVIGVVENGWITTRKHEFAHAFSYVYPEYRKRVSAIVNSMSADLKQRFWNGLSAMGVYSEDVLDDEIQAYLSGYAEDEFREYFPEIPVEEISPYQVKISTIFEQYYKKYGR